MSCHPHLDECLDHAAGALLAGRTSAGHWEGCLSSSALSTATAVFTLYVYVRADGAAASAHQPLIDAGLRWLVQHQNPDGGWGDTVLSVSNISTTALCWAALSAGGEEVAPAVEKVERWLASTAGSLNPDDLAEAIARRYGKDRTFSVPILTMCALAGRLGSLPAAWGRIPQLPFELAAFPHRAFKWFHLPVVSYALPALIAIGQVRHRLHPTRNPLARIVRHWTAEPTLRVLQQIQPRGGGFLEATPLTSFVSMSLIAAGYPEHPVVREGLGFIRRSVRPDGSWPIDTDLATWVTTLSVNALAGDTATWRRLAPAERPRLREWLLNQQYRDEHPYTHADPGGWAWTDLPGGVPDADDTAGALIALRNLCLGEPAAFDAIHESASMGLRWLLDLQNRDGGIPTFCRGWGALPFDRSGQDLTAHAMLAWIAWRHRMSAALAGRIDSALRRAVHFLRERQRSDGAWTPLWFGNQHAPEDENPTYGTARVLLALAEVPPDRYSDHRPAARRGLRYLVETQQADGGWGAGSSTASSIEETALAVHALAAWSGRTVSREVLARGVAWLVGRTDCGRRHPASPIGFYFAKLWYFETLYPLIFSVAALARVRCGRALREE